MARRLSCSLGAAACPAALPEAGVSAHGQRCTCWGRSWGTMTAG